MKKFLIIFISIFIFAFIFCGATSATGLANSPQPVFQHDNNNTGQSQYKGPQRNGTKWKFTTHEAVESSPAIGTDGTIYIGSNDHYLYAIYPNGTKKWKFNTNGVILSSPAIGTDGTIYIGSHDNNLYAIYPNGTKKWNFNTGGIVSCSPKIAPDGTIYIGNNDGKLYALYSNGKEKWEYTTTSIEFALAIDKTGNIYFTGWDGNLYALKSDGSLKWKYYNYFYGSSVTIGNDGTLYIGSFMNNWLYAITPSGSLKWYFNDYSETGVMNGLGYVGFSTAIAKDGTIYIGCRNNKLYALTPNGTLKWSYSTKNRIESSPTLGNDGSIYFGCEDGYMYALNPSGTLKWKYNTGTRIYTTPAIGSDGSLYFGSDDGKVYAIADLTVSSTPVGGYYNVSKKVTLKASQQSTIYYTLNGATPTIGSYKYSSPIAITKTTVLKFFAKNQAGTSSPIYTQSYIIDKIPPKVSSTTPTNLKTSVSKTTSITIKFNEKIKSSIYFNNIKLKNLSTGTYKTITKTIVNNMLYLKSTSKLYSNTWYQVIISSKAVKDYAGNNLAVPYTFKFKTGP